MLPLTHSFPLHTHRRLYRLYLFGYDGRNAESCRSLQELDLRFHAIYSGFLASERQIGIVSDFIRTFRRSDTLVVIDPVMGDDGKAYQTYTSALCSGMTHLAELADVITPNLTEAAFFAGPLLRSAPAGGGRSAGVGQRAGPAWPALCCSHGSLFVSGKNRGHVF